jgi:hypothetical protein
MAKHADGSIDAFLNFVKRHNTLRCTPAMAAGVTPGIVSHK